MKQRVAGVAAVLVVAAALSACGSSTPGCADSDVQATTRDLMLKRGGIKGVVMMFDTMNPAATEFSAVRTEKKDSDTGKVHCAAVATIPDSRGKEHHLSWDILYTSELTEADEVYVTLIDAKLKR